jgi:hypothetical protein
MKICFTVRVLTLLFVKLWVFGWFWMIQTCVRIWLCYNTVFEILPK